MEPVLVSKHIIKLDASHERLGTQSRLSVLDTLNGRYIIHFGYVYLQTSTLPFSENL